MEANQPLGNFTLDPPASQNQTREPILHRTKLPSAFKHNTPLHSTNPKKAIGLFSKTERKSDLQLQEMISQQEISKVSRTDDDHGHPPEHGIPMRRSPRARRSLSVADISPSHGCRGKLGQVLSIAW